MVISVMSMRLGLDAKAASGCAYIAKSIHYSCTTVLETSAFNTGRPSAGQAAVAKERNEIFDLTATRSELSQPAVLSAEWGPPLF
jgi:hypothetical protein